MVYTLRFSSSKCSLFHNSNVFGSRVIQILYTGCAKIKKRNNSGAKRLKMSGVINPRLRMSSWCAQGQRVLPLQVLCASHMSCVRSSTLLRCKVKDALDKKTC